MNQTFTNVFKAENTAQQVSLTKQKVSGNQSYKMFIYGIVAGYTRFCSEILLCA